jgi:hypothetical protein
MLHDILKNGGVQLVHQLLSVPNGQDKPGFLEHREMSGNGRPRSGEVFCDLT